MLTYAWLIDQKDITILEDLLHQQQQPFFPCYSTYFIELDFIFSGLILLLLPI